MLKQYVVRIGQVVVGRILLFDPVHSVVWDGTHERYMYHGDGQQGVEAAHHYILSLLPTDALRRDAVMERMDIGFK